jgi:hypothetical protein
MKRTAILVTILALAVATAHAQTATPAARVHLEKFLKLRNQITDLETRLIARYKLTQTWEELDASQHDQMALVARIIEKEMEFTAKSREFHVEDVYLRAHRADLTPEGMDRAVFLLEKASPVDQEFKGQSERFHALMRRSGLA